MTHQPATSAPSPGNALAERHAIQVALNQRRLSIIRDRGGQTARSTLLVDLNGNVDSMTDAELEAFVESFPI